uniref:P-type Ca(2+) transporter n=1 Tax=Physcomitrium patens TaxID=3218 RepID=A0A7I4C0P0_PHYPA
MTGAERVTLSSTSRLRKLPIIRAQKNAGATDLADKVSVDSTAPSGASLSKPQNGGATKRVGFSAWTEPLAGVLQHFNVDLNSGLGADAVEKQRLRFGWNELEKGEAKPFWLLVVEQFEDTLVQILLAAAGVSFLLALSDLDKNESAGVEAFTEPLVILSIIILNAVIGVWQERKAESTLESLKEMQSESSRVLRDATEFRDVPSRDLVPGDIVELRAGDKVAADMRIAMLKSGTIRLQQASLTGESQPVLKQAEEGDDDEIELQGKLCMAFAGTTVTNGSAVCVVTDTGMNTEIGKIQSQIHEASLEDYDTPLSRKLDEFADLLTKVVGTICIVVWLVNYKYFVSWEIVDGFPTNFEFNLDQATYYFKVAVALAVAAIPEGLPAVITTCLALGTRRMAEENAIVRKLPSVETLGCTSVICSDKTGTLTTNQMSVVRLVGVDTEGSLRTFRVSGTSYDPRDGEIIDLPESLDANLQSIAQICSVCNDAGVQLQDGVFTATGMPTEAALKVLVEKLKVPDARLQEEISAERLSAPEKYSMGVCKYWAEGSQRLFTLEFDRLRKSMGVIIKEQGSDTGNKLLVKGAAECVLERCTSVQLKDGTIIPLSPSFRQGITSSIEGMACQGLRVLACAFKRDLGSMSDYNGPEHPAHQRLVNADNYSSIESELTFVGLGGLQDPPRKEVKPAIEDCKKAGIRVVVITGDNKSTAEAICREIGLFAEDEDLSLKSLIGRDFMKLSSNERRELLLGDRNKGSGFVFSRAEPIHKQEIVRVLKAGGEIVAMTGDGVNDAPALKLADIGIAMGITGTEVAKEASDMVLADDDFATIVKAVREGRSIYDNMKSFIRYLISSNIGEVVCILLTALLGFPQGLIPVQLLWVNLVTDGAPATALGFNPPDPDIMERPPRPSTDGLVSGWTFFRFMVIGSYVGLATVGVFALWYLNDTSFLGIDLSSDGHSTVTFHQLSHWGECSLWPNFRVTPFTAGDRMFVFGDPCDYFSLGKLKASTLSMSTLVVIEMFNALNALSENNSLLTTPGWVNRYLLVAIAVSMGLHFAILYTPWLADSFGVVPLNLNEWLLVVAISFPIIPLDELLKVIGRQLAKNQAEEKL